MKTSVVHRPKHPIGWGLVLLLMVPFRALAQSGYLLEIGSPTFTVAEPVHGGFLNVANGNLHIEIPFVSLPQRGGRTFVAKMVYDSRI